MLGVSSAAHAFCDSRNRRRVSIDAVARLLEERRIVNPLLGPLADHGGGTLTMLPRVAGPAIDAASDCSAAGGIDQRGITRPQGAACDLGAVELAASMAVTVTRAGGNGQHAVVGSVFAAPLVVRALDANNAPVSNAVIVVHTPPYGASSICSSGLGVTDANGYANVTCIANGVVGSYPVNVAVASVGGTILSAVFTLTNEPGDYIFADGFDTVPTLLIAARGVQPASVRVTLPTSLAAGRTVSLLRVVGARGQPRARIMARGGAHGIELRTSYFDTHGDLSTPSAWTSAPASRTLRIGVRGNAQTLTVQPATTSPAR